MEGEELYSLFEMKTLNLYVVSCDDCGWETTVKAQSLKHAREEAIKIHEINRACESALKVKKIKKVNG